MTDLQERVAVQLDIDRNRAAELAACVASIIDDLPEDTRYAIREAAESRFKTYREGDWNEAIEAAAREAEELLEGAKMAVNLDISLGEQERFLVWVEALGKTAKAIRELKRGEG